MHSKNNVWSKRNKCLAAICAAAIVLAITLLCVLIAQNNEGGFEDGSGLCGRWAYNHDPETVVLELKNNGKAVLDGKKCSYKVDGDFLVFSGGANERCRYVLDKDGLLFYKTTTYTFDGEIQTDLVGKWKDESDNWSFEFTDKGTFMEDDYFPGYYVENTEEHTIKLIYNDHFEDTVCYYSIEGDELTLEYPWRMVKAQ